MGTGMGSALVGPTINGLGATQPPSADKAANNSAILAQQGIIGLSIGRQAHPQQAKSSTRHERFDIARL